MVGDLSTIDATNLPTEAVDEFRDGEDLETSLWDDGPNGEHRRDVLLSLLLKKRSIGEFSLALLWQDDPRLGEDLGRRIVQSPGDTPYVPGHGLHYHVSNPTLRDAESLLLAAAHRNEAPKLTRAEAQDLIEDAFEMGQLPTTGLDPSMSREIDRLISARFVNAETLRGQPHDRVFDIRGGDDIEQKIAGATRVPGHEIEALMHRLRVGKENVFTLYCDDGTQSKRVARELRARQKRPRILIGGFAEWRRLGFEVEET